MKSKKAELTRDQIAKLVFAVLCILVIIAVIVKVYSYALGKSDKEKAEATFVELKATLNSAKIMGESEMKLLNPKEWWIIAWPYEDRTEKPSKNCKENCICICPITKHKEALKGLEGSVKACDDNGICEEIEEKIKTIDKGWWIFKWNRPIPIREPVPVEIKITYSEEGGFVVEEV